MRTFSTPRVAMAVLIGLSAVPVLGSAAFAGADDGGTKAFWLDQTPANTAQAPTVSNIPTDARANYQGDEGTARPVRHHVRNLHHYVR